MISYNIRTYISVILFLAFGTYLLLFLTTQNLSSINIDKALSQISTTISFNIIIWSLFVKWFWKWKVFYPWLVPFPNLSGKWEGTIKSNWKGTEGNEIPTEVIINQTFFNVQVKVRTGESRSYSIGASFDIDKDRGLQQLFYSYLNTPKAGVRERSEIHYGSTLLHFEGYDVKSLEGEYWTSRETTGEIILSKKS